MGLSAFERERNLLMNDEEDLATVYTAQPATMRKLAKHPQATLLQRHEDENGRVTGEEWSLPKGLISIRSGRRAKRVLTEAEKERRRTALARIRDRRGASASKVA